MLILGPQNSGEAIIKNLAAVHGQEGALDTKTEVAVKEILGIDAAAPGVIHSEISVFAPWIARGCVNAGQAEVEFIVGVPLWTFWYDRLGVLVRIDLSARNPGGSERHQRTQAKNQFFHS